MRTSTFTTSEVAKICQVSERTVAKWLDMGLLKGYRLPGSRDRRVTRDSLVRFFEENGIPLLLLEEFEAARAKRNDAK
jgi:excisionase family DNA binding protein